MAESFIEAGYPARHLSSKNGDEIKTTLEAFYRGDFKVLVSVDLFIMGFTVKDCECIVQARPTMSLMIYMQILGRGMMTSDGKPFLINIDAVNNVLRHGMPEETREWSLEGSPKKPKEVSGLKRCPSCQRPVKRLLSKCNFCGYEFPKFADAPREMLEKEGEMIKVTQVKPAFRNDLVLKIARGANTLDGALMIAKNTGGTAKAARFIWEIVLKKSV
jgi:superfamily II DNA or RNA helicase